MAIKYTFILSKLFKLFLSSIALMPLETGGGG